jgi:hypothetical protein
LNKANNAAHYKRTLELLEKHGIREFAKADYGDQLTQSRLDRADITVCMNQRVYDECLQHVTFPASPYIWSVTDIGEPGRIAHTELENHRYREDAYQEIVMNVDRLISDISGTRLFDAVRSANLGVLAAIQVHDVGVVAVRWLCDVGVPAAVRLHHREAEPGD